ncbi:MAG: UbiX family flavin prenyltransferase [Acidobacteriota bacterium]
MADKNIVVAITGASGAPYARKLLHVLAGVEGFKTHLVASSAGKLVYGIENGVALEEDIPKSVKIYDEKDFTAPFASGSFITEGMAGVPCTMGTLASIANGISQNLIHRAADVCLKERRKLVLLPRETPLSRIHLANMLRVSEAGGIILPPMPGFYHRPQTIDDLVNFVVGRVLEQFGIKQSLVPPWNPDLINA